jgi:SAM-dependent methyltransferase
MTARAEAREFARYRILEEIVCCPDTRSALRLVELADLEPRLAPGERDRIPPGTVGAFVSLASRKAFPFTQRIVSFLDRDALVLAGVDDAPEWAGETQPPVGDEEIRRSVQSWYDTFGWQKNEAGAYNDTAVFSQTSPEGYGAYELVSHLSILDRLRGGRFVLDAASGAIAHPEYLAYSWFFRSRICVDMSTTALEEAATKLRDTDFCCLADICRLPFCSDVFDGVVSGYTIQHIPAGQQAIAVTELHRVLGPGAHLCIFTDVEPSRAHRVFYLALRLLALILRTGPKSSARPSHASSTASAPPARLYFMPRPLAWWRALARGLSSRYSIEALRTLTKSEFERIYGGSNRAVAVLRAVESSLPRLTARASHYCLVDIEKPAE